MNIYMFKLIYTAYDVLYQVIDSINKSYKNLRLDFRNY